MRKMKGDFIQMEERKMKVDFLYIRIYNIK